MKKRLLLLSVGGFLLITACDKQESESDFRSDPQLKSGSAEMGAFNNQVSPGNVNGQKVLNFRAHLDGGQEVPPRETQATGQAVFRLSRDGKELHYKLLVANLENIVQAHIHVAGIGVNGPVVTWLYPSAPPAMLIPGVTNGPLHEGVITDANLVGLLAGSKVADLVDLMAANNTYVNIHTSLYPGGEIRGQIFGKVPVE
jgi:hypothetical protein